MHKHESAQGNNGILSSKDREGPQRTLLPSLRPAFLAASLLSSVWTSAGVPNWSTDVHSCQFVPQATDRMILPKHSLLPNPLHPAETHEALVISQHPPLRFILLSTTTLHDRLLPTFLCPFLFLFYVWVSCQGACLCIMCVYTIRGDYQAWD